MRYASHHLAKGGQTLCQMELRFKFTLLLGPLINHSFRFLNNQKESQEYESHYENGEAEYEVLELYDGFILLAHILNQLEDSTNPYETGIWIFHSERDIGAKRLLPPHEIDAKPPKLIPC